MPTITVHSRCLSEPQLRRFALRMTKWFRNRDVDPDHVVVSAQDLSLPIYTGASPRTDIAAAVSCRVGVHRDAGFLSDLASEITCSLKDLISAEWIQITFERHSASDTFIFDGSTLWNANAQAGTLPA